MSWRQALRHVPTEQRYVRRVRKALEARAPELRDLLELPDELIVDGYYLGYTVKEFVKEVLS